LAWGRQQQLVFVVRKGDLASVQARIGVQGGTEIPENRGNSQSNEHTGVIAGVGGEVGSRDVLLEVLHSQSRWVIQGPMWRHYLRDGLDPSEMSLVQEFRKEVEAQSKQAGAKPAKP
jgi:hypothetical protein